MAPLVLLGTALAVTGAHHDGVVTMQRIDWTSTWHSPADCVALAQPIDPPPGFRVREAGATWQLCRNDARTPWVVTHSQPFPADALEVPLLVDAAQRIDIRGARFEPADRSALEKHMSSWSTPGLSSRDRRAIDRRIDGRRRPTGVRLYVAPGSATDLLAGRLDGAKASGITQAVSLALLLGVGGLLAAAYRLLERRARAERVSAWLAENLPDESHTDG